MKLSKQLQQQIFEHISQQKLSLPVLVSQMGYSKNCREKAVKRLQSVLFSDDLGLSASGYDFKYSNREFIVTLCQVLQMDKADYNAQLETLENQVRKIMNAKMPMVRADIDFNTDYQQSFMSMMAMSRFKNVKLDQAIRLQSKEQQLESIRQAVEKHYSEMRDKLPYDGVINAYHVFLYNDNQQCERLTIEPHNHVNKERKIQ